MFIHVYTERTTAYTMLHHAFDPAVEMFEYAEAATDMLSASAWPCRSHRIGTWLHYAMLYYTTYYTRLD